MCWERCVVPLYIVVECSVFKCYVWRKFCVLPSSGVRCYPVPVLVGSKGLLLYYLSLCNKVFRGSITSTFRELWSLRMSHLRASMCKRVPPSRLCSPQSLISLSQSIFSAPDYWGFALWPSGLLHRAYILGGGHLISGGFPPRQNPSH